MKVLVTGGMGYIGSHTVIELIMSGYEPIILDDLSNSKPEVLNRIEKLTEVKPAFYPGTVLDVGLLDNIFVNHDIKGVIHFAGLKAVGESVQKSVDYYATNVGGTLTVLQAMKRHNVNNFIFSSSATVYGDSDDLPLREDHKTGNTANPYGHTKYLVEEMLKEMAKYDSSLSLTSLRYFNPVGAHKSGLIGEDPTGKPNNLMPFVSQVAVGKYPYLSIFGNDYPTLDGTGVRDYIHVVDLAIGHVKSLNKMLDLDGFHVFNLGTGNGTSVIELVSAFEKAANKRISIEIKPRRDGDIAACWADASKAKEILDWEANLSIDDMCEDTWRWQSQNPCGYY
ncbi:UDP-glucose 4-epimerase GalE [Vibrio mediterranei]|jgi:UDP-glucose 4-epimerase|uniref:UDP-glucose 4-epimerase GalE n=1 Tax=Vibrio mediterranei TaxID=689 RepID=UPI001EFE378A|nr:UDP-glucose 4-epimerase GalE [Vibrio mediterranei]MCG9628836.1 UDP-glucose 4-epimerase GalE [Vibrio mediterranei]